MDGEKGTRRDSTGLPKAKRLKQTTAAAATAIAAATDQLAHCDASEGAGSATASACSKRKATTAIPCSEQEASSSCNSSEADLEAHGASTSARACRARQLKTARERTMVLAKAAARRASTDENEDTALHRPRNLRKRMQWRESVAAQPARS